MEVVRYLRWYDKTSERLAGELQHDVPLAKLQALFGVPTENIMYDCWPVTEREAVVLRGLLNVELQLDKFDYFVEANAS